MVKNFKYKNHMTGEFTFNKFIADRWATRGAQVDVYMKVGRNCYIFANILKKYLAGGGRK